MVIFSLQLSAICFWVYWFIGLWVYRWRCNSGRQICQEGTGFREFRLGAFGAICLESLVLIIKEPKPSKQPNRRFEVLNFLNTGS